MTGPRAAAARTGDCASMSSGRRLSGARSRIGGGLGPGVNDRKDFLGVETEAGLGEVVGCAAETERCRQLELAHDALALLELAQDPIRRAPHRGLNEGGDASVHADLLGQGALTRVRG